MHLKGGFDGVKAKTSALSSLLKNGLEIFGLTPRVHGWKIWDY